MKKKKFQAVKADVGEYQGVVHDGKEYRFRKDDTFIVEDEGLAKELDSMYGRKGTQKLAISPYYDYETREPGHNYTFRGVDIGHIKITRDNGYVWVRTGVRQVRMKKTEAVANGYEIIPQKRKIRASVRREV